MVFWYTCVRVVRSFKMVTGSITGYWFLFVFSRPGERHAASEAVRVRVWEKEGE